MCQSLSQPLKRQTGQRSLVFMAREEESKTERGDKHTGCPWERKSADDRQLRDTWVWPHVSTKSSFHFPQSVSFFLQEENRGEGGAKEHRLPSLDPSFSLVELLVQVTYSKESKLPLPQTHVRRRCHQCPL